MRDAIALAKRMNDNGKLLGEVVFACPEEEILPQPKEQK
jgi:hypothetical protein